MGFAKIYIFYLFQKNYLKMGAAPIFLERFSFILVTFTVWKNLLKTCLDVDKGSISVDVSVYYVICLFIKV